jgi:methyl-accepting chemotaxis protein-1 (serine sensor receptor)
MFSKFTLRTRLLATMGLLGIIILVFALVGIMSMRSMSAGIEDLYSNQLVSSISINDSKNFLSRARFNLDKAILHPEAADIDKTLAKADGFVADSNKAWQKYLALPRDAEEDLRATSISTMPCWPWAGPSTRMTAPPSTRWR